MKVKRITFYRSQTFNLGEYNSVKFAIDVEAELEDDDNMQECRHTLQDECRIAIREAAEPFVKFIQLPAPADRPGFTPWVAIKRLFLGKEVIEDEGGQ